MGDAFKPDAANRTAIERFEVSQTGRKPRFSRNKDSFASTTVRKCFKIIEIGVARIVACTRSLIIFMYAQLLCRRIPELDARHSLFAHRVYAKKVEKDSRDEAKSNRDTYFCIRVSTLTGILRYTSETKGFSESVDRSKRNELNSRVHRTEAEKPAVPKVSEHAPVSITPSCLLVPTGLVERGCSVAGSRLESRYIENAVGSEAWTGYLSAGSLSARFEQYCTRAAAPRSNYTLQVPIGSRRVA